MRILSIQSKRCSSAQFLVFRAAISLSCLLLAIGLMLSSDASAEAKPNTCVECHGNSKFLVQNKKIFDYFQEWKASVHSGDITCDDCHGGDPSIADKEKSHFPGVAATDEASGVHFKNVVDTCGGCHEEILNGFKKSEHFQQVVAEKQEDQGPTCVTCHGSIDVKVLDITSVADACLHCHNEESDNYPENPEIARETLSGIHSINRFYRYIIRRIEPSERDAFFKEVDGKLHHLAITWHTFDLDEIEAEVSDLLNQLTKKREEVRAQSKKIKEEASN